MLNCESEKFEGENMRILDEIPDNELRKIVLYLTHFEAAELRDSLDDLLKKNVKVHAHVPSEDFEKEITVCIYDVVDLNGFNERSINLIKNDR